MDPKAQQELSWLAKRLKEPSTYAGVAAIAAALHFTIPGDLMSAISSVGVGVGGLLAFFLPESKPAA